MSYFNHFSAHDQFFPRPLGARDAIIINPRGKNVNITENINIKNGPSGFWGFMAGLGQGIFGVPCNTGSIFGCPSMPMMPTMPMMPMNNMMFSPFSNTYGLLNSQTTVTKSQGQASEKNEEITKLEYIHSEFKIVYNNGEFRADNGKGGHFVASSFSEMDKLLADYKAQNISHNKTVKPEEPKKDQT